MPSSELLAVPAKDNIVPQECEQQASGIAKSDQQQEELLNKEQQIVNNNNINMAATQQSSSALLQDQAQQSYLATSFHHESQHNEEEAAPQRKRSKPNLHIVTNLELSPISPLSGASASSGSSGGKQRSKREKTPSIQEIVAAQHNNFQIPSLLHDALIEKKLHVLNLSSRQLKNSHIKEMCETLTLDQTFKNIEIEELNLSNNLFDDNCAPYLAQLIAHDMNIKWYVVKIV